MHSLSVEANEIAFKPSADTYVFMPVSKAMKMARCPVLRKKPMLLFLNLMGRYTEIQSAAHQAVCSCNVVCARARMKAMGRAESVEVIIHYWSSL